MNYDAKYMLLALLKNIGHVLCSLKLTHRTTVTVTDDFTVTVHKSFTEADICMQCASEVTKVAQVARQLRSRVRIARSRLNVKIAQKLRCSEWPTRTPKSTTAPATGLSIHFTTMSAAARLVRRPCRCRCYVVG